MSKRIAVTAVVLLVLGGFATLWAAGVSETQALERRTYPVQGFSKLSVSNDMSFTIRQGDDFSVEIQAPSELFSRIRVNLVGQELRIYRTSEFWLWGPRRQRPHAEVTMPRLSKLQVSGASQGSILFDARKEPQFIIKMGGASRLDVSLVATTLDLSLSGASKLDGMVEASHMLAQISGASKTNIAGGISDMTLNLSGASTFRDGGLTLKTADLVVSGASTAEVRVEQTLRVNASSASTVRYRGNPKIESSLTGASYIRDL